MNSSIIEKFWRKYRKYKIEKEDLEQEASLAEFLKEDVEKHLFEYCEKWRRDRLSVAVNIGNKELLAKEEDEETMDLNGYWLSKVKEVLTEKQFAIWYAVRVEGLSIYNAAKENCMSLRSAYDLLNRAQKKIKSIISEG